MKKGTCFSDKFGRRQSEPLALQGRDGRRLHPIDTLTPPSQGQQNHHYQLKGSLQRSGLQNLKDLRGGISSSCEEPRMRTKPNRVERVPGGSKTEV